MKNSKFILAVITALSLAFLAISCGKDNSTNDNSSSSSSSSFNATAVDLGLSVKWASYDVGAKAPHEEGDYFTFEEAQKSVSGKWKVPSKSQFYELVSSCEIYKRNLNGINGWEIIGPNGKSIFFAGDNYNDYYWTSTPTSESKGLGVCFQRWIAYKYASEPLSNNSPYRVRPVHD